MKIRKQMGLDSLVETYSVPEVSILFLYKHNSHSMKQNERLFVLELAPILEITLVTNVS